MKFTIASIYLAYKAVRKSGAHTHGRVTLTELSHLYRHESKSDGSITTRNQMINDLGFKIVTLLTSAIKNNARDVEDALQLRFQGLPLGCRLWRSPDQGAKFEMPDGKIHSVGIVYSDQILPMINTGMLKVCK